MIWSAVECVQRSSGRVVTRVRMNQSTQGKRMHGAESVLLLSCNADHMEIRMTERAIGPDY